MWVLPVENGAQLRVVFRPSEAAEKETGEFLQFVSKANNSTQITRYLWHLGFFVGQAWFPNVYQYAAFDSFLTRFITEVSNLATLDPDAIAKFFPVNPKENR